MRTDGNGDQATAPGAGRLRGTCLPALALAAVLAVDLITPTEVSVGALYTVPIALTMLSGDRRMTYVFVAMATALILLVPWVSGPTAVDPVFYDQAVGLAATWMVAGAVVWMMRGEVSIEGSDPEPKHRRKRTGAGVEGITRDIRESEAHYRSLFENNKAVMLLIDPSSGSIVDANQAATEYYGYDREQITSMRIADINTLGTDEVKKEMDRSVTGVKRTFVFSHRLSSGEVRDVEVFSGPIEVGGRPLLYSIVHDITVRKQAERDLEQAKGRLEAIIKAIPAGITIIEPPDGRTTFHNEEAGRMMRLSGDAIDDLEERLLRSTYRLDGRRYDPDEYPMTRALRSGDAVLNEVVEFERADGTRGFANANAVPVKDSVGNVTAVVGLRFEITREIEAQRELALSNSELRQFAHVASHDLREPLRMITAYLDIIGRKYDPLLPEDGRRYMKFVYDGAQRMRALIDDLLEYSRVGSVGRGFSPVDMSLALSRALSNLSVLSTTNHAVIEAGPLPMIIADEAQMTQLLQNLVGNAIKYHGERPPMVRISCVDRDDAWLFSVQDNGIGIAAEHRERVFEMFHRLHTREEYEGTGIGLAIAKRIVERHGGRIWIEAAEGGGSKFFFTLPKRPRSRGAAPSYQ